MRDTFKYIAGIVLLSLLSISAKAQDTLSLSQAVEIALQNNFQVQIGEIRIEQAAQNNTIGQAGGLPTVAFSVTERNSLRNNNSPTSFLQGNFLTGGVAPNIDMGWVLFNGFRVKMSKDKLEALQMQSQGNAQLIIENTIQSVILAYNNCLVEREKLKVFEKLTEDSRKKYEYAESKKNMGLLTTFDVLQEKNSLLTDSANLVMQVLNYDNSLRNLNVILGQSVETSLTLSKDFEFETKNFDKEEMLQAMSTNTSLQTEMINISLRKSDLGIAKSQLYPTFKINVGSNYGIDAAIFDGNLRSGSSYDFYLNFSLNWTLFNGGTVKNSIANAQRDIQISELQVDEVKLSLHNELLGNIQLYETRKSVYAINESRLETARLSLELAQDRYKSGLINSIDYRVIQNNFLSAELTVLSSVFQLIETETELLRLTGGIVRN